MGDQIFVVFPETGKKHCFFIWANSPGWNWSLWYSFSATLISTLSICNSLLVIPGHPASVAKLGIQVPERYGSSVYHFHLLQDFLQRQVSLLITGLVIPLSLAFQGSKHRLLNLRPRVLLRDVFLYLQSPIGVVEGSFLGGFPE